MRARSRSNSRETFFAVAAGLAFLLGSTSGATRALADDAESTAKKDEAAAVPELMEFNDRARSISIQLPRDWNAEKGSPTLPTLAAFMWPAEEGEGRRATVEVLLQRGYARAELARQMIHTGIGEIVEGSLRRGDGFSESCVISAKQPLAIFDRFVEQDGFVYHVRYVCHKSTLAEHEPVARAVLDTFKVLEPYEVPELPDGWERSNEKPFTVWCDDEDRGAPGKVMGPVVDVRKVMEKALRGDPADPSEPVVRVYRNAALYEEHCRAAVGQERESAAYDATNRALLIELMKEGTQGFEWAVEQMAAQQYIHQYFGGSVPLWISRGLMIYGAAAASESGGKPQKPAKTRTAKVKGAVIASSRRLDQYFELESSDIPDDSKSFDELWAWHWFFRHAKGGKKYRKTYEECLEVLRSTGDLAAAHAVWEGTDFAKLQSDWRDWGKSLK